MTFISSSIVNQVTLGLIMVYEFNEDNNALYLFMSKKRPCSSHFIMCQCHWFCLSESSTRLHFCLIFTVWWFVTSKHYDGLPLKKFWQPPLTLRQWALIYICFHAILPLVCKGSAMSISCQICRYSTWSIATSLVICCHRPVQLKFHHSLSCKYYKFAIAYFYLFTW